MDSAAAFPPSAATAGAAALPVSGSLTGDLVKAKDLSHHLSELAKARRFSPLKSFSRFMGRSGIISLAGGLPDPSYFPFDTLGGNLLAIDTYATEEGGPSSSSQSSSSWLASWFTGSKSSGSGGKAKTQQIAVPKFAKAPLPDTLQLSQALQYGGAQGLLFLQNFLKEWTTILSPPLYEDWDVLVDDGATDGWHKVLELLCNPGDPILVEAWTYPSAVESGWPMGVRPVPCPIDADGLVPDTFEKTLREWDEEARGCKRPRVLYTVPVGQNPCGSVADVKRKQQIYDICVKYDVILCEDDPYYILQFPWEKEDSRKKNPHLSLKEENRQFLRSLSPSYLTIDYEGRVIRLDTFSKTVAPGSRLGWITSNAKFSERLLRASETSTQQPSGFAQVLVCKMIETWGMEGWIRWLRGLRSEYRERRDVTVDALHKEFKIETVRKRALPGYGPASPSQSAKMVGYAKYSSSRRTPVNTVDLEEKFSNFGLQEGRKALISFSPPEGGMFVWINLHLAHHSKFKRDASPSERSKQTKDLMNSLWEKLADNNVLIAPGWMFAGDGLRAGAPDDEPKGPPSLLQQTEEEFRVMVEDAEQGIGHFRLAFSYSTHETLRKGIKIFAETVVDFFDESA